MTTSVCSRCGGPLTASASGEYCPRCAGRLLLDTAQDDLGVSQPSTLNSQPFSLRLGEYELGPELGRGAMGVVYRARQRRLRREVAVKVILASRFAGESARKRFLAEAELAAQLDHPNIVAIYEVGETADGPFYAMKLVEGGTLADWRDEFHESHSESQRPKKVGDSRSSSLQSAARLIAKIARAVHHAHERGVLHRDLKPGNILIDAQGEPHVTDFGLARQLGVESSLTLSGSTLGTPAYMSPEQARGEKTVTTASDVWSLGAILYHLLAGRPPFPGNTAVEVLRKVMEEEPVPPSQLRTSRRKVAHSENVECGTRNAEQNDQSLITSRATKIDRDLETICLKCLEKDPARRYGSALALAEDLERWRNHEPIRARPATAVERVTKWARRRPAIAALTCQAGVLVVVAITGITWQWRRAEAHAEEGRERLVRMATATAIHRVEEGDLLGALPWFVEALRLDAKSSAVTKLETSHRMRFATTLRQAPRLMHLWFHDGAIKYAQFSPDGRRVVTASKDGTARIWNTLTGEEVTPPLRHARAVNQAVFSSDGKRIATGSRDGTARMWDAQSGDPLTAPIVHDIRRDVVVALSPDGDTLITAAPDSLPVFWNARTGERLDKSLGHTDENVDYVIFSPNGRLVLTAGVGSGMARLWNAATGQSMGVGMKQGGGIRTIAFSPKSDRVVFGGAANVAEIRDAPNCTAVAPALRHDGAVSNVEFSHDGSRIVTASFDGTARVWDARTGQPITPPLQHSESVRHAAFSPDGRWVVTASEDHTARVWDATRGAAQFPPLWHGHAVECAVFSPDGRFILTTSLDGTVRLWNFAAGGPSSVSLAGDNRFKEASLNRDLMRVSSISRDNTVQVWNAMNGEALSPPLKHNSTCNRAVLSPDGLKVATGSDGAVKVWEIASGKLVSQVRHRSREIGGVTWRPDGQAIVSWSIDDTEAQMWDSNTGSALMPPFQLGERITFADFSPDSERLAMVNNAGIGRIWDGRTGQPITPLLRHGGRLIRVRFSLDGKRVVTCSDDGTARMWDATTGQELATPLRHGGWVKDALFSPDGRRILTSSEDGTARLWDSITGRPLTGPLRLGGGVAKPSFSSDGRRVLAGNGRVAQVWDAETGTPLTPPLSALAIGFDVIFSPDERSVLAVTFDRRVVSWDITPFDWPLEDLAAAARLLSCRQIDATGSLVPLEQVLEGTNGAAILAGPANSNRTNEIVRDSGTGSVNARALLRRDWERLRNRLSPKPAITSNK